MKLEHFDRWVAWYLSGFAHGILFAVLLACLLAQYGCSKQRAKYLVGASDTYEEPPKAPAPPPEPETCVVATPPLMGALLPCQDLEQLLTPAECERFNTLRKLDHYRRLQAWADWVVASCDIYGAPPWDDQ